VFVGLVLASAVTACEGDGGSDERLETLTVRREMPAGPLWEEGSTMVVRVFDGDRLVREVQSDAYQPAEAAVSLKPGSYRVVAGQTPCSETCRGTNRDPEQATCERSVEVAGGPVELVVVVPDPDGCQFKA